MATVAGLRMFREATPRPSRRRIFWALALGGLGSWLSIVGALFAVDSVTRGSLEIGVSPPVLQAMPFSWPSPPDDIWMRGFDVVVMVSFIWLAAIYAHRSLLSEVPLGQMAIVLGVAVGFSDNSVTLVVLLIAGAAVLHQLPGTTARPWSWRLRALIVGTVAALWLALSLAAIIAANAHPIGTPSGVVCGPAGGSRLESPLNPSAGRGDVLRFPYHPHGVIAPALCLENRSWTRTATVVAVSNQKLDGPWDARLTNLGPGFGRFRPITLQPHHQAEPIIKLTLRACSPDERGKTFTLKQIPLTVLVGGRSITEYVRLTQAIQVTCTY